MKFGKFLKSLAGAVGGLLIGGPAGAVAGAGLGYSRARASEQRSKAKASLAEYNRQASEVTRLQENRARQADVERQRLQKQESDRRRASLAKRKGRRSLLSGLETGLDENPTLKKTLG